MKLREVFAVWSYAFFLQSGFFKSDPRLAWIPIDLTILLAVVVGFFILWELLQNQKLSAGIFLILLFFVLLIPSLFASDWTIYQNEKTLRLFTQTILVAVAPFFLIKNEKALSQFLKALVFLGSLIILETLFQMIISRGDIWRISPFGASVIGLGRSVGLVTICFGLKIVIDKSTFRDWLILMASVVVLLASGQRMAIIGPALAVLITLISTYGIKFNYLSRLLIIALLIVIVVSASFLFLPERARLRLTISFSRGLSAFLERGTQGRTVAFLNSFIASVEQPFGLGLGGFAHKVDGLGQYPHNIIAEVFVEAGWLAGVWFIMIIILAFLVGFLKVRNSRSYINEIIFGMLVFSLLYALVAGDINDNRMLFAFISVLMSVKTIPRVAISL